MGRKEECHIRIKKAMNLRGLSQTDIVEKTNIKKSALSQYISGKITPRQNVVDELSKVLNVSEPWLMGYDVPMERGERFTPMVRKNLIRKLNSIREDKNLSQKKAAEINNLFKWISEESTDSEIMRVCDNWDVNYTSYNTDLSYAPVNPESSTELLKIQKWFIDKTKNMDDDKARKLKATIEPIIDLILKN